MSKSSPFGIGESPKMPYIGSKLHFTRGDHPDGLFWILEKLSINFKSTWNVTKNRLILRHIGLLEVDEDKIRKIRPKGTQVRMLYVPREAIRP